MIKVEALTTYPLVAPGPRVRIAGHAERLAGHEVDLHVHSTLTAEEYVTATSAAPPLRKARAIGRAGARRMLRGVRSRSAGSDLRMIHRIGFLTPIAGFDPPRSLDVYDFDDALYLGSIGAANRSFSDFKREAERWQTYVRRARLVLAGNAELAAHAARYSSNVEVVPSCVEPADYQRREHFDRDAIVIGWIGSASTSPYLEPVVEALDELAASKRRFRFIAVGAGSEIDRPWAETREWSLATQHADIAQFDIGVMPMPDTPWTRGKCGYKLLQYFASGVPAVVSPVGVARGMAGDDRALLASSSAEWARSLEELMESTLTRAGIATRGIDYVNAEFSVASGRPKSRRSSRDWSDYVDFTTAYETHIWHVYGFLAYRTRSRADAEDLTQETFERALKAWSRFDPARADLRTWLLVIARNTYIDSRRRAAARPQQAEAADPDRAPRSRPAWKARSGPEARCRAEGPQPPRARGDCTALRR